MFEIWHRFHASSACQLNCFCDQNTITQVGKKFSMTSSLMIRIKTTGHKSESVFGLERVWKWQCVWLKITSNGCNGQLGKPSKNVFFTITTTYKNHISCWPSSFFNSLLLINKKKRKTEIISANFYVMPLWSLKIWWNFDNAKKIQLKMLLYWYKLLRGESFAMKKTRNLKD